MFNIIGDAIKGQAMKIKKTATLKYGEPKKFVTLMITPTLHNRLKMCATSEQRSLSDFVEESLRRVTGLE